MTLTPTLTRWRLKACPRCGGDMCLEEREYDCLQCGYCEPTLSEKRAIVGLIGGLQTKYRTDKNYFSRIGRLGGRPKNLTLSELRQQSALTHDKGGNGLNLPESLVDKKVGGLVKARPSSPERSGGWKCRSAKVMSEWKTICGHSTGSVTRGR